MNYHCPDPLLPISPCKGQAKKMQIDAIAKPFNINLTS